MNQNIEKILAMLTMESIKVRETGNIEQIENFYLEVQRFIKTEYEKLDEAREQAYLKALGDQEEAPINGYLVSYKSQNRFALDSEKLKNYFHFQLGIDEEEMRNQIYSHSTTKPSLKLKTLK